MEPVDASGPNHKTQKFLENNNKKKIGEKFFLFQSSRSLPPRVFWKGMKVKILLIKVWLALPHPVTGDLRGSVGRFGVQMWILALLRLRRRPPRG